MQDTILTEIYGRGWAFPPEFNLDNGVTMAEGGEDVHQSLRILFSTEPGERIMRFNYGCALYDVMFETISSELMMKIKNRIRENILRFEPRACVNYISVEVADRRSGVISVCVDYYLRGSQVQGRLTGMLNLQSGQGGMVL